MTPLTADAPGPPCTADAADAARSGVGSGGPDAAALAELDARLEEGAAAMRARNAQRLARRQLWLSHHWPDHHAERCLVVAGRPVCRRCAALYPLSAVVAVLALVAGPPWPAAWDPWPVWILSLPATVAFVGEALGWFGYSARWQAGTTLVAALAFGRAWGAELADGGQPMFWGPITVFGGLWFAASAIGHLRRARLHGGVGRDGGDGGTAITSG